MKRERYNKINSNLDVELCDPKDYKWVGYKLHNRRISIGTDKNREVWIQTKRLGSITEPKVVLTSFRLTKEASEALLQGLLELLCKEE